MLLSSILLGKKVDRSEIPAKEVSPKIATKRVPTKVAAKDLPTNMGASMNMAAKKAPAKRAAEEAPAKKAAKKANLKGATEEASAPVENERGDIVSCRSLYKTATLSLIVFSGVCVVHKQQAFQSLQMQESDCMRQRSTIR